MQTFSYNGLTVRFFLLLYAEEANRAPSGYRAHRFDDPAAIAVLL